MGLFDRKPVVPEAEETPGEYGFDAERYDREFAREKRIEEASLVEFNKMIVEPAKLADSKGNLSIFHVGLTKDLTTTKITEQDVTVAQLYISVINHALYLELDDFAKLMHADFEGWLAAKCSVGGFGREALIKTIIARGNLDKEAKGKSNFKFMG